MGWAAAIPAIISGASAIYSASKGGDKKGKFKSVSTLTDRQENLHNQLTNAGLSEGAGGAFGTAADYYRDLLSDQSKTAEAQFRPEIRRFNEEIIPDLSEQFAGMGAGNLSSSGFRNAAVNAGTDLSERLGAIRANLRAQGAAGLANIGAMGLNPVKENIYMQGQQGGNAAAAQGIGNAAAQYAGNWFQNQSMGGGGGSNITGYGGGWSGGNATQMNQANSIANSARPITGAR